MKVLLHIMNHSDWCEMLSLRRRGEGDGQDGCAGDGSGLSVLTVKRDASDVFED